MSLSCRSCGAPLSHQSASAAESLGPEDLRVTASSKQRVVVVRCPQCRLVQAGDAQMAATLMSAYAQVVDPLYEEGAGFRSEGFRRDLLRCLDLARAQGRSAPTSILEIGAFVGLVHSVMQTMPELRKTHYLGLEPSDWAVAQARAKGRNVRKGGIGPGQNGPSETYDWIVAWDVIEHLENPHDFFVSVNQAAKSDSWLLINTPDWDSWWRRLLGKRWWFVEPMHRLYFDRRTLARIARQHGWELCEHWRHRKYLSWRYLFSRAQRELFGRVFLPVERVLPEGSWIGLPLGQMTTLFRKVPLLGPESRAAQGSDLPGSSIPKRP